MKRRRWLSIHDLPKDQRVNRLIEARASDGREAFAYWSGDWWARAPVRPRPRALGWRPEYWREPLTPEEFAQAMTKAQRRVMLCLRHAAVGHEWRGAPDSALDSCVAPWRRGYLETNSIGAPDATISAGTLWVKLSERGRELLFHVQKGRE